MLAIDDLRLAKASRFRYVFGLTSRSRLSFVGEDTSVQAIRREGKAAKEESQTRAYGLHSKISLIRQFHARAGGRLVNTAFGLQFCP